jgi:hypothetical protein
MGQGQSRKDESVRGFFFKLNLSAVYRNKGGRTPFFGVSAIVTGGVVNFECEWHVKQKAPARELLGRSPKQLMNDKYIRDRTGKIIGYTDGEYLKDGTGRILGKHTKSDDFTRDREGKIVGKGDQLMRLLKRP